MTQPSAPAPIRWHTGEVTLDDRQKRLEQRALTVWITGLSGTGKSTLAYELERQMWLDGRLCYVLDGDNLRHGLNHDLNFSAADRKENIRRAAEVARLLNDTGVIVIAAFISPYRADREMVRQIIGDARYFELHLDTPLAVCEARDAKGLYARARNGEIPDFTGISSPYEAPERPALRLDASTADPATLAGQTFTALRPRIRTNAL